MLADDREVAMLSVLKMTARPLTVLAVAALLAAGVTSASGTVVSHDTFEDSELGLAQNICGIAVIRDSTFSGRVRIRVNKASGGEAFMSRLNFRYVDTYTNPLNEATMTFEGRLLESEIKATHVEGNVYSFTTIEAGQPFVVRDSSGNVVLRDRGLVRHRGLFDTLGDGTPGGVELDHEIIGASGPHPGLEQSEAEFCAMVQDLLG
jgi:hypothetical protein